jgi:hypothetical protein
MVKPAQPRSSEGSYDLDGLNAANQRAVVVQTIGTVRPAASTG